MHTHLRIALLLSAASLSALAGGCTRNDPPQPAAATPQAPLVVAPESTGEVPASPVTTEVGGIVTTYIAHYSGASVQRITELRASASEPHGEYEFLGARLLRYRGKTIDGGEMLELEFDLNGSLVSSRKGSSSASPEDIAAIRSRASVLRSLALAQHATQSHVPD
jgi:hypothetical protein